MCRKRKRYREKSGAGEGGDPGSTGKSKLWNKNRQDNRVKGGQRKTVHAEGDGISGDRLCSGQGGEGALAWGRPNGRPGTRVGVAFGDSYGKSGGVV